MPPATAGDFTHFNCSHCQRRGRRTEAFCESESRGGVKAGIVGPVCTITMCGGDIKIQSWSFGYAVGSMPTPPLAGEKKKKQQRQWWLSNRKAADKYIRDSRTLIATQEPSDVSAALGLLDAALALSPGLETALELKARCLLSLRRFRDVADMLQEYIPSNNVVPDDDSSNSSGSSEAQQLSRERAKLLSKNGDDRNKESSFRCFSVSDLKRKVMATIQKNRENQDQWRYLILGQACYHLGLMEDAMALLQTGRRLAAASFRRESISQSDDNFAFSDSIGSNSVNSTSTAPPNPPQCASEPASHLLPHIKLLVRRRAAALAALDAGIPSESIRHFSKILDGRRGTPHAFAASCFVARASAYRAAGRLADSIADCNRALALDPTSIPALRTRADVLESVRALPDCLRDLDHLKLLYDVILRGSDTRRRDVPGSVRAVRERIQALRRRVASGEGCNVDYHALLGVRRGCTRSELERAHLLLLLKHKPDKAAAFVDRLEFADEHRDLDSVRDQVRMSALILYRMLSKGFSSVMLAVMDEEAMERQRAKAAANDVSVAERPKTERSSGSSPARDASTASVYQGVFCRGLAAAGNILSIPVKC